MLKKGFLVLILFLFIISVVKATVGVGITYGNEELFLNEFKENCITYKIYNPFDSDVTATVDVGGGIASLVTKIEPKQLYLPGFIGLDNDTVAKLANNKETKVCFKPNTLRWPPFYPVIISGVVLAKAARGDVSGTGSATVSSVQAPLTLRIGSMKIFYNFIIILVIIIALIIIFVLRMKKKLPKRKRKYCEKCEKKFSAKNKFCPDCGGKLEPIE